MKRPIHRSETLVHQVYHYLKQEILGRQLSPGEKLVESKLSTDLGVSRSPVREAIRLLVAEELLFEDEGTIRVFLPSYKHLNDLFQLRLAVECFAASLAAKSITQTQLDALEENIEQTKLCIERRQYEDILGLNAKFHEIICEASGNSRFMKTLKDASTLIYYYYYLLLGMHQREPKVFQAHVDIYNALVAHDSHLAFLQMHRHVSRDFEIVQQAFQEHGFVVEMDGTQNG